jgi:hypothetical protein
LAIEAGIARRSYWGEQESSRASAISITKTHGRFSACREQGKTLVLVTHDSELIHPADRVFEVRAGSLTMVERRAFVAPSENAAARVAAGAALVLGSLAPSPVRAQIDEIQVYTGEINKPGEFSITLHDNYTVIGPKEPAFLGGIVPDHSLTAYRNMGWGSRHGSSSVPTSYSTPSPATAAFW